VPAEPRGRRKTYQRHRYDQIQDPLPSFWAYPQGLYLEAEALERLGDRDEARRVLGKLLRLWRRADPDLPLLRRARNLEARLADAPGRK
jgi:hypothetical protein